MSKVEYNMYLNIFESIKRFIYNLFSKFDLGSLSILLFGIIIGFVLCMAIYLIIVFSTLKKSSEIEPIKLDEIDNIRIKRVIENAKNEFVEVHSTAQAGQKIAAVRSLSWQIIQDIAQIYYPDSAYPVYELSVEEMITLNHYITNRIDELFAGRVLGTFKSVKISQILRLIELKKKIDENKVVKLANKVKMPTIYKSFMNVLNIFNPVYWVRKMMLTTTLDATTNKIANIILDVVGDETNKVYSRNKTVFSDKDDISTQIREIESLLETEK